MNPYALPFAVVDGVSQLTVSDAMIEDAAKRLERFAPFLQQCFPETEATGGLFESPLKEIPTMQKKLEETYSCLIHGRLFLKMDSHLAIAGSVKARGGIYEVLKHAEDLAIAAGKLRVEENYAKLAEPEMREFFGNTVKNGAFLLQLFRSRPLTASAFPAPISAVRSKPVTWLRQ
jgi:D-serine dehydratase